MKLTQKNVDNIIQEILNEEIDRKVSLVMEKLHGNQDRIDVAKPKGVLNKKDFDKLRKIKKMETKEEESGMCSECGGSMYEGECMECGYGGGMEMNEWGSQGLGDDMLSRDWSDDELSSLEKGFDEIERMNIEKPEKSFFEKLKSKLKKKNVDIDEEMEEGNAFSGALAKAKEDGDDEFSVGGKKYPVKESLKLTESELIDFIEKVIIEQNKSSEIEEKASNITKKVKDNIKKNVATGLSKTEKSHFKPSKKENDDYISSVTSKMKDYLKNMGDSSYEMSPKGFPKGNGQFKKGDVKGYEPSDAVDEYIQNFTAAGLENLTYDEIHPDEKWVDDNVEGSSRTGNNPTWANAVDTGVNKKRNEVRKDNLLGAVKQMAYNKAPQPVVDDMKKGTSTKFARNFGKDSGRKATKILNQLESKEKTSVINEEKKVLIELEKIKNLYTYNRKTQ